MKVCVNRTYSSDRFGCSLQQNESAFTRFTIIICTQNDMSLEDERFNAISKRKITSIQERTFSTNTFHLVFHSAFTIFYVLRAYYYHAFTFSIVNFSQVKIKLEYYLIKLNMGNLIYFKKKLYYILLYFIRIYNELFK